MTKCNSCNHPMSKHKDIADSKGHRDGKHIHCLQPTKQFNSLFVMTCGCKGNTKVTEGSSS